jgi:hypothetical protein
VTVPAAAVFAKSLSRDLLEAYKCGEMTLTEILVVADRIACLSGDEARLGIIGELAIRALYIPKRKELNSSRPPYPKWFRNFATGLFFAFREFGEDPASSQFPKRSAAATRKGVIAMLGEMRLLPLKDGGKVVSEATLRKWCEEHQRSLGKAAPRGRPRKNKLAALS